MLRALLATSPFVLAPMADVTDAGFRRICRELGAHICVTEFVGVEQVIANSAEWRRKIASDDGPTAIQIYGADARLLLAAARIAADARPAFLDLNCGCWIPTVVGRGAGAAWLRDPAAMVAMVRAITAELDLPVTVKTRIGWGPESPMPIVDLARRLEDAGVAALTIHCRTADMGHRGAADWTWARRAREAVTIPVIVNGDVWTAEDAVRALAETGCAGVMIGRAAITHPWIFREARALLDGRSIAPPTDRERAAVYRAIAMASVRARGESAGIASAKRHSAMLLDDRTRVLRARSMSETIDLLG
ncbi:MAG: tRNA-dihydrouridine synthase family protein [Kofleriaceae bacterium]